MNMFLQILAEFGLPVAAASIMGFFIYLIIKYILESVVGQVKSFRLYVHTDIHIQRQMCEFVQRVHLGSSFG